MFIIEREDIDIVKWDALVESTSGSSSFSTSWYLDATAENWCVLIDENYTCGIALPYSKRATQEILYTPIFVRCLEWLGDTKLIKDAQSIILERFKIAEITFKSTLFDSEHEEFVYQIIYTDQKRDIRSQAIRSLKKADKMGLSVRSKDNYKPIFSVIKSELEGKFRGIDGHTLTNLEALFVAAQKVSMLRVFEVYSDDKSYGGVVCIQFNKRLLYLKGAVDESTKKNGGMYLALNEAINYAAENQLIFDFGGSRQEGVMAFNHNLGGVDTVYYSYRINNGPKWFSLARSIRNKWIKK